MSLDMDSRLADMPIMAQRPDHIDAAAFNVWRRARRRWGNPMRLEGLGLKQMEMILCDRYWVCVDSFQHDCPVLAWVDIEDSHRDSLHKPIACTLNYYHFAASALREPVLKAMQDALNQRLKAEP